MGYALEVLDDYSLNKQANKQKSVASRAEPLQGELNLRERKERIREETRLLVGLKQIHGAYK